MNINGFSLFLNIRVRSTMKEFIKILLFMLTVIVLGSCTKVAPLSPSITPDNQEENDFVLKNSDADFGNSEDSDNGSGTITDPDDDGDDGIGNNGDVITDPDDDDDEIFDNDGRLGGDDDSNDDHKDPIDKG